jgi:hypothetical protein
VPRGIDEIECTGHSIPGLVGKADRLTFDGNPSFPFDIHIVEDLILEIPLTDHAGILDQPVRQRGLAVVDMGDDAEITNIFHKLT